MFCARYFCRRFFAARYWPKVGGTPVVDPTPPLAHRAGPIVPGTPSRTGPIVPSTWRRSQ